MDRERDVAELNEELELMKSVNNIADQANRRMEGVLEEYKSKVQSLEV